MNAAGLTLTYVLAVGITCTATDHFQLLDNNLLHYEALHYDSRAVHEQHVRLEGDNQYLYIHFHAYGRDFNLQLARDTHPLSPDFQLIHKKTSISDPDLSFLYTGVDTGHPGSDVHGAVVNGTFQGTIHLPGDTTYHVEPNNRMFSGLPPFHSIIYSQKDYNMSYIFPEAASGVQNKLEYNFFDNDVTMTTVSRVRRAAVDKRLTNKTCTLKLVTDHMLWRYLMDKNDKNEDRTRNDITSMLTRYVRDLNSIFGQTTFTLDKGGKTERRVTGINFEIRSIEIMTTKDCLKEDGTLSIEGICDTYLPPEKLLERFADRELSYSTGESKSGDYEEYDYKDEYKDEYKDDYKNEHPSMGESTEPVMATCLTFLFTARVLFISNGNPNLGLTYSSEKGRYGGICSDGANNGFVTLLQFTDEKFLPTLVTSLVFVHEVAHAFGAQHDNDRRRCGAYPLTQEPPGGFYLMHTVVQRGHLPNHKRFSNCSLDYMSRILSVPSHTKCFRSSTMPARYCGNSITEDGEECDCGMSDTCTDPCCHGYNSSSPELGCTLKDGATCSPSQGPCCNSTICQVIGKHEDFVCQNTRPCVDQLICDGIGSACPEPQPSQIRQDGYICNDNGRMCEAGSCNASVCKMIGWRECQLTNDKTKLTLEEKKELCTVGCKKTKKSECISTNDEVKTQTYPELSQLLLNISSVRESSMRETLLIQFPIGMPCNRMTGYCDVFHRCRGVDPDTPLVQLKNCLTSGECLEQIGNFMEEYWWAAGLITLLAIVLFGLFVKCCAIHTKSSNPALERRHPSRSFRESMHRISQFNVRESINMDSLRRVRNSLRWNRPPPSAPPEYDLDIPNPDPSEPLDPEKVKMTDTSRMN